MSRFLAIAMLCGACATTPPPPPEAAPPAPATSPASGPAAVAAPPPIGSRAQRAFDDAVAAVAEAKKLGVWDWQRLEKKWTEVLEAGDDVAEAHHNLGVIAEKLGRRADAKAQYQKALAIKPSLRETAGNLAALELAEGNEAQALEVYRAILREWPDDAGARVGMAEMHRRRGDDAQATALAREALARDPKFAGALKVLMRIALGKKDLDLARLLALRALNLLPDDPEIGDVLGQVEELGGSEAAALVLYKKAVKQDGSFLLARIHVAAIALRHQDYPGAAEELGVVAAAAPERAAVHLDLGVAWRGAGDLDKAEAAYTKARQLDPKLAEAVFNLGVLQHRFKNEPGKALELYKDFLRQEAPPADHPCYALLKEAEELLRVQAEMKEAEKKAAEEEAKKKELAVAPGDAASEKAPPPAAAPAPPPDRHQAPTPKPAEEGEPDDS